VKDRLGYLLGVVFVICLLAIIVSGTIKLIGMMF
jgi:hypothetical protein